MNSFRTPINIDIAQAEINHKMKGLAIGSCFVEHIGGWLQKTKFDLKTNPFGIVYNPISIGKQLSLLLDTNSFPSNQLFKVNELWHSFDHHSQFSGIDKQVVVSKINNTFTNAKTQLKDAHYLIITFGTANVYVEKKSNQIVSNCHKIPSNEFDKKRLTVKEIMTVWEPLLQQLKKASPELKIIFTVSPVRHLKNGIIENQRSKAVLLLAVDNLVAQSNNCHYFPAYEIMMDDLRDYRFYDKDMIHPNEVAIDYIKDKFAQCYFDEESKSLVKKIEDIQKAVAHKAFRPASDAHQDFLKNTAKKIELLEMNYDLDFSTERMTLFEVG